MISLFINDSMSVILIPFRDEDIPARLGYLYSSKIQLPLKSDSSGLKKVGFYLSPIFVFIMKPKSIELRWMEINLILTHIKASA